MARSLRAIHSQKRELSAAERKILGIIHHLRGVKETWADRAESQASAQVLQEKIKSLENDLRVCIDSAPDDLMTFSQAFVKSKSTLIAGLAVIFVGTGALLSNSKNNQDGAPALYFLSAAAGIAALVRTNSSMRDTRSRYLESNEQKNSINEKLKGLRDQYLQESSHLKKGEDSLPNIVISNALLPLERVRAFEKSYLISKHSLVNPITLKSIAFRDLTEESESIFSMTKRLESIPVLLTPSESSIAESLSSDSALHGEERDLKEAVGRYVTTLSTIKDETIKLPAVQPDSALGRALEGVLAENKYLSEPVAEADFNVLFDSGDSAIESDLSRFEQLYQDAQEVSATAIPQLEQVNKELTDLCKSYRAARTSSTNDLHLNYQTILNRANWTSKRFYCPRSILSRAYLEALIGLDFDSAHNLDHGELVDALHSDEVISKRLNTNQGLIDDISRSHAAIHDLINTYSLNIDENGIVRAGFAAEHIVDQFNQELSLFRQRLTEALTGRSNGFLGISESARLFYDPHQDIWLSPVLPYTYTTAEVEQYGQLRRTEVDLLIPLWEHLWTEKADFRKSELFRTNESIQRMSEKEGEKIKQIAYQFQSDLREVRSNLYVAKSEFDAKLTELSDFEESIENLGLMDSQQRQKLDAVTSELSDSASDTTVDADGYELILLQEPANQLLRRQSKVHDPIDVIQSPDLIIEGGVDKGIRRLSYVDEGQEV